MRYNYYCYYSYMFLPSGHYYLGWIPYRFQGIDREPPYRFQGIDREPHPSNNDHWVRNSYTRGGRIDLIERLKNFKMGQISSRNGFGYDEFIRQFLLLLVSEFNGLNLAPKLVFQSRENCSMCYRAKQ